MKNELPREMQELSSAISRLPLEHRKVFETHFTKIYASNCRRARILEIVQEALSQLRLDLKYVFFDLECTKRERDEALNNAND